MDARPAGLVVLLLVGGLSGCLERLEGLVYEPEATPPAIEKPAPPPTPSEPLRSISVYEGLGVRHDEYRIAARDGIQLVADAWIPLNNATVPVVVVLSPYFEGQKNPVNHTPLPDGFYGQVLTIFTSRGYAVALVDLRGTRLSQGCIDLAGPNEQQDAYDVVEFFGTQPWSNGKVGMIGASYDGLTQLEAAAMKPPHLAAIVPIAPVADWYHVQGKGGAKFRDWTPFTPYSYNFEIGDAPGRLQGLDQEQTCAIENQAGADDPTGDYNEWMKARDLRPRAEDATAAMFYVHGFVDVNARPDHIDPWYNEYGGPKRAFLWQMAHAAPTPDGPMTGFRPNTWWSQVVMWFDHHLMGLPNRQDATYGTVEVQDSLGRWRLEDAWPPKDVSERAFFLDAGRLSKDAPGPGSQMWHDAGNDDGRDFGYRTSAMETAVNPSRLTYKTPPLAGDLHYAGRPIVRAFVETTQPSALLVVRLYDVLPDGSWVLVNRGVHTLRHRDGLESPQPVQPLTVYEVHAQMQPVEYVFRAGHAVGLTVSGSDDSYILPTGAASTNTVHYGSSQASQLVLPETRVDPAEVYATSWGDQQPSWMGPYAWGGAGP